ncbi:hypothetical protein Llac01_05630 [Leuconostoc lactis]|nr:hypothetical protein LLA04_09850 [Leuconostoc lactis]GLY45186.1 hypothetical protein Llac01_05630 [Leuconostoc lactis]
MNSVRTDVFSSSSLKYFAIVDMIASQKNSVTLNVLLKFNNIKSEFKLKIRKKWTKRRLFDE